MPFKPMLHVIAGVNGAGKTSFYRYHLEEATPGAEFVNADELARERWPGRESEHVVEAARLAAERRIELLDAQRTFVTETVFSHESKLELATNAECRGFRVILYHIQVGSAALARARIAVRVEQGGHDVSWDRVEARYERSLRLIPEAARIVDHTFVFDNSGAGGTRTHRHVMTLTRGRIVRIDQDLPDWVERAYRTAISTYRSGVP